MREREREREIVRERDSESVSECMQANVIMLKCRFLLSGKCYHFVLGCYFFLPFIH